MRFHFVVMVLLLVPGLAVAASYVDTIQIIPPHPDPMEPVTLSVTGSMPSSCWALGGQSATGFSLIDSSTPDIACLTVIVPFDVFFDLGGLPEGVHTITVSEWHQSLYDPGQWSHPVTFTVGDPPVEGAQTSWSAVKALYR